MRTKLWGRISVLASIVAGAGAANAADLAVKAPVYKAPPPVIISDWAGFYIGANGGGGFGTNTFNANPMLNTKPSGGLGGGQIGYNWQFGSFVVGLEGDFDGADVEATQRFGIREHTTELATARGRAGYAILPSLLAYGTGGYAYGHTSFTQNSGAPATVLQTSIDENGWVAGGGLEYKLWGPVTARGEYLHYGFGNTSVPAFNDTFKQSIDVVRGGLNYKF
jgi:outer membrane immunogenic protein